MHVQNKTAPSATFEFAAFVAELHLAYLCCHCAWGGPARIPPDVWAWSPDACPARISPDAARAFRLQVEAAARVTSPEDKRGGVTYAAEVRRLHDALAAAMARASDGAADVRPWPPFALARVDGLWEVGCASPDQKGSGLARREASPPVPLPPPARSTSRREALGIAALLPSALLTRSAATTAVAPGVKAPSPGVPDAAARVAGALRDLERLPWRDRYPLRRVQGRDEWQTYLPDRSADARLRELGVGPFITAGALARRLAATLMVAGDTPPRRRCVRAIDHADRADHVRYHAATAERLLARLRPFAMAGTHWAGPYAGTGWSWDALVSSASFDLSNFAAGLTMREACILDAGDPLTFEAELQIALDPFLFRRAASGSHLIGSALCASLVLAAHEEPSAPVTYVWLLDDEDAEPAAL